MQSIKLIPPLSVARTEDLLLEKLMHDFGEAICIIDHCAVIQYLNRASIEIMELHLGVKARKGACLLDYIPQEKREIHTEFIEKAFRGEPTIYEFPFINSDIQHWLEVEYGPLHDEQNGSIAAVCLRVRDITDRIALRHVLTTEQKNQQKKILKATLEAEDKQRSQIGRELHDNVNQVLTTIKLYAELCLKGELDNRSLLEQIVTRSNYCIEEIRNLSRKLSTPLVEEQGIEEMMQDLVESVRATQKVCIRFRSSGIRGKVLNQEVQTAIFRIAQEQLTNVLKHAEATIVDVILVHIEDHVALQIQDNGKGFEYDENKKTSGLTNMISRAENAGGHIEFQSAPGSGCVMNVEFRL